LAGAPGKFFWENYYKYFKKKANFGEEDKILKIFDKNVIFSNFGSNFKADFGDPCDYYKSVTKNWKLL